MKKRRADEALFSDLGLESIALALCLIFYNRCNKKLLSVL